MFNPFCSTYTLCHVFPSKCHFCTPAVASVAASATFPFTAGTIVPSPSSQTYSVVSCANQMPKGYATGTGAPPSTPLASVLGKPGRIVIGTFFNVASLPVGSTPALPTWYTVLIPLPPLPFVTYSALL